MNNTEILPNSLRFVDEFRSGDLARNIAQSLAETVNPERQYAYMEFCGGHTHAISRYGIEELLPPNVRMVHGPGCPVCVLPIGRIDQAIQLAIEQDVILCTYGDTMRVPASNNLTLMKAKAQGAQIRMVYAATDALKFAQQNPQRQVVFFAIGFETTTPPTAVLVTQAQKAGLKNLSVLCCHVLTPAAIGHIMDSAERGEGTVLDGFVGPAHVSTVIGSNPYVPFAQNYQKPVVIAGFEPLDVLQAVLMLVRQTEQGRSEVENEFIRAVTPEGNLTAQKWVDAVFCLRDSFEWRGLGTVPFSALRLRDHLAEFDAEKRFGLSYVGVPDHKQCECGAILRGVKRPVECKLFGNVCTPETPVGSCMVSSEGACAAHYSYGRFRDIPVVGIAA